MRKKVIYIAGQITGIERYWEAFEKAEDELSAAGFIPLSPARLPSGLSKAQYMRIKLAMLDSADAVLFLRGYSFDSSACIENQYCAYTNKPYEYNVEGIKKIFE